MALVPKEDGQDPDDNIKLNEKQKLCIEKINSFLFDKKDKYFYLLGYAGTGKTFLIGKIIKDLLYESKMDHIFICAPTHQALYVIESYLKSNMPPNEQINFLTKMSFVTIHKLLEFKPVIMADDGSKIFKSNKESKFLKRMEDKLVVIDECSMISRDIVIELNKYVDLYPLKVIFLGDSAQLPPVHEKSSIIFSSIPTNYKNYILLDEIMRTKSQDIKDVATIIRSWNKQESLVKSLLPIYNRKGAFKMYHKKKNAIESTWFKTFTNKIKKGQTPIILTWKNDTADYYNMITRKFIHKTSDLNHYIVGDYAMFTNYYSAEDGAAFYTSNMIKILAIKTESIVLFDWNRILLEETKTEIEKSYNTLIKKLDKIPNKFTIDSFTVERIYNDININNGGKTHVVQTVHQPDLNDYRDMLEKIREHIEVFHKKYKSEPHTNRLWDVYHKKLVDPYANLSFGYSLTTHKSQGSTFEYVFVDLEDVSENMNMDEMQHLLYTAATRCSKELGFILG